MDVHTRSALIITLAASSAAAASEFHESLQAGTACSSEKNDTSFEILDSPAFDGFFNVSNGLCKAYPIDSDETETLFPVGHCLLQDGQKFTFMFGGWLNMLTVRFDHNDENRDLFCR
jgi:hypothetical protein